MPPSWFEAKRKAPSSDFTSNGHSTKSGSAATETPSQPFYKLFESVNGGGANDFAISNVVKKPRLSGEPAYTSPVSSFGSQSKLKRPSSSASPRLASLSEKFSFKPSTATPSSTVFSRYNSMLGSATTSPPKPTNRISHTTSGATAGLDPREEIIAKRLQSVFRTVPSKMINYAVKKMGTFDSAADWLENQDLILSKNSRNSSASSSSRSSPSIAAAASRAKGKVDDLASDSDLEELDLEEEEEDDLISEAAKSGYLEAKREVSKPTMSIRQKFSHRSAHVSSQTEEVEEVAVVPKRRLVRAQPTEDEIVITDESGDEEKYDDVEEIEFESRVLEFMNTASVEDIADMAACELSMAEAMVAARPFDSLDEARAVALESEGKSNRKKTIGEKIIDAAYTVCFFAAVVEALLII